MAQNSDELINQILEQLNQAQQPAKEEAPALRPEEDIPPAPSEG